MAEKLDMYTGCLQFRNIDFTFAFDKRELRLVPSNEYRHTVEWDWMMQEIKPGVYIFADPILVEEPFLIGQCNETNAYLIFIPKRGSVLNLHNSVVRISLTAYIICHHNRDTISRITLSCPEINYIHPVNQAVSLIGDTMEPDKGVYTLSTQDFDATTTETQLFTVDSKEVKAFFGIHRMINLGINQPPLSLESALMLEFEPTDDYSFIHRLWWIGREFIRFLCYRKNVCISEVELYAPYTDGKHEHFATMVILNQDGEPETDALKNGLCIKQLYISEKEGKILCDIDDGSLYLRHLPDSCRLGRRIDAARFVMITAAFEWEFRRVYPNGVRKSEARIAAEKQVTEEINKLINATTGRQKNIYKHFLWSLELYRLETRIIQAAEDFSEIVGPFGELLYKRNGEKLDYNEMANRLAEQRNSFAHGNLDKDFIGLSVLDLVFMQYLIYAMQLKYYGVEDKKIQKAINELFHLNFAI